MEKRETTILEMVRRIADVEDFKAVVTAVRETEGYSNPQTFGLGLAHIGRSGKVLSVRYPNVNFDTKFGSAAIFHGVAGGNPRNPVSEISLNDDQMEALRIAFLPFEGDGGIHPNMDAINVVSKMSKTLSPLDGRVEPVVVFVRDLQSPPISAADAYLRLHLISFRKTVPNSVNLDGAPDLLTDCVWTEEEGPVEAAHFDALNKERLVATGLPLTVRSVGKIPRMTDFVVPSDVRIDLAESVRLGAHLAPGTVVLPGGSVDANAGTLEGTTVDGVIPFGTTVGSAAPRKP